MSGNEMRCGVARGIPVPPGQDAEVDHAGPGSHGLSIASEVTHVAGTVLEVAELAGCVSANVTRLANGLGGVVFLADAWVQWLGAEERGAAEGLLRQAFDRSVDESLAATAVILGLDACDVEAMRATLSDMDQAMFDDAYARQRAFVRDNPGGLEIARERFMPFYNDHLGGIAAAIEGWNDSRRSDVFQHARERMSALLDDATPAQRAAIVAQARESKIEGTIDAARGRVDRRREMIDPSYRSGVRHARDVERWQSPAALRREVERLEHERFTPPVADGRIRG